MIEWTILVGCLDSVGLLGAALVPGMAQKKAEQARPPQATRTLSPWALLRHQHIPGPTAGQAPWGRWLPPIATGRLACAGGCGAGTIRRAELSWASQGLAAVWG